MATGKTNWELVEQYYIEPLRRMKGHEAFVCLTACFPLYEKYLRRIEDIPPEEKFAEGHRVFRVIGKHFGISEKVAYEFWTHWRNGLLHRGMPGASLSYTTWLTPFEQGSPVVVSDMHISINPWSFRNFVLNLLDGAKKIWKDNDFPLLQEIRKI
jgi:hypothetical protein